MKHSVIYDDQTGNVEDTTGGVLGMIGIGLIVQSTPLMSDPALAKLEVKAPADVSELVKLKTAGFTAEEIVLMTQSGLL